MLIFRGLIHLIKITQDGLRIFNIDPIREQAHYKEDQVGSIAHAEMLYRTNLVAMVSGGGNQNLQTIQS